MNADGSSPLQLSRGPDHDLHPMWAANDTILFLRKLKGGPFWCILRLVVPLSGQLSTLRYELRSLFDTLLPA